VSGAESWQNFYVMVGGAAAALTGLVLVAVSLHLTAILAHPLYRDRAHTSLQGLITILVVAGAMLTPQPSSALGIEVLLLGLYWLARFARFIRLFTRVRPHDRAAPGSLWVWEWLLWLSWVAALVVGGVFLLSGDMRALYVLAPWAVSGFVLIVWNAWVLMSEVGNSPARPGNDHGAMSSADDDGAR
jgi:hypothetical protein